MELARTLKYYGYLQFQSCICDFPKPDTSVLISAGNKELNFRWVVCEDQQIKLIYKNFCYIFQANFETYVCTKLFYMQYGC